MRRLLTWAVLCGLSTSRLLAADASAPWPQFRGPAGSGVADDQKPPVKFGPSENVRWQATVPSGFSSPIVVGELVVLTGFENNQLSTIAYDRKSGVERWRAVAPAKQIEKFHATEGSPAASTPVTDGQHIVSYFGSCGLICYDLTGKELWKFLMPTANTVADFGSGVSPVLVDGIVVLVRDQATEPKILAVDVKTGQKLWETARQSVASHSTPVITQSQTGAEVVTPGVGRLIAYDLKTGSEKWWVEGQPAMCCASPVIAGNTIYHAAWSPGEDFKLPGFDEFLTQTGDTKTGYITREGLDRTQMKGMFDSNDSNKDNRITRDEWDAQLNFLAQSRNSAFAVRLGGTGNVTESHVVWRKPRAKGLPMFRP